MRVAILGGGQLAQMLAQAAAPLGIATRVLDPAADCCAGQVTEAVIGDYDDPAALAQLAADCDVATYEFENVPEQALQQLADRGVPIYPSVVALRTGRDRLLEKRLLSEQLGVPTAPWRRVDSLADLRAAVAELGLPALLKTRTLGYDGKGQSLLQHDTDIARAWQQLGGVPLILEGLVRFDREVSIIAARGRDGAVVYYPLVENRHRDGILRYSQALPNDPLQAQAEQAMGRLLDALDYVGVAALELFDVAGTLLANEMAPRVHNSGHWSLEGALTSQFANHLRAICGMPLGATKLLGCSAMINLIGTPPPAAALRGIDGVVLHDYGKDPRPGRKVAHIGVVAESAERLQQRVAAVWQRLPETAP